MPMPSSERRANCISSISSAAASIVPKPSSTQVAVFGYTGMHMEFTFDFEGLKISDVLAMIDKAIEMRQKQDKKITLHPNGFLQLSLDMGGNTGGDAYMNKRAGIYQLHIWDATLPKRSPDMFEIHDHAFGIHSFVLVGKIMNSMYGTWPDEGGGFRIFRGDGAGNQIASDEVISYTMEQADIVNQNNDYEVPKGAFHSSKSMSDFAVTFIVKKDIDTEYKTKVIAPLDYSGGKLEFDRDIDQEVAWAMVEKTRRKIAEMYS